MKGCFNGGNGRSAAAVLEKDYTADLVMKLKINAMEHKRVTLSFLQDRLCCTDVMIKTWRAPPGQSTHCSTESRVLEQHACKTM